MTSARKLRYRPRNSEIKVSSKRLPARTPAATMLKNRKPRQKELILIYTS
jgi:hypothetical protein